MEDKNGGIEAVKSYYHNLGGDFYQEFIDMLVFDAIILNKDRHFENFCLLIDNHTNVIIAPAPIFDNGLSLLCYAMDHDFKNIDAYIKTKQPASYQDFISFVKPLMNSRQKEKVRKLLDFHFDKQSKYKLNKKRLKQLELLIKERASTLLD